MTAYKVEGMSVPGINDDTDVMLTNARSSLVFMPGSIPDPPSRVRLSKNIVHRLTSRARARSKPSATIPNLRQLYLNIFPNATHFRVEDEPSVAIRKFSPCGRYLVSFSRSVGVHFIRVFKFKMGFRSQKEFPKNVWKHFFQDHFTTSTPHVLNKDFCLFTRDSRFVLTASSGPTAVADTNAWLSRFPGSLSQKVKFNLEDVRIYVIDMQTGNIVFEREFICDHINFAHNTGTYLHGDMLAVLAIQTQQIHIIKICEDGSLVDLQTIGPHCFPDDELFLDRTRGALAVPASLPEVEAPTSLSGILRREAQPPDTQSENTVQEENLIVGLKQRLMAFLYLRAKSSTNQANALRHYYNNFGLYESLCIWKVQILEGNHLLIKYGSPENAGSRAFETQGMLAFFVVYDFMSTKVINVYENNSEKLLECYQQCADHFRNNGVRSENISTPENSLHNRAAFQRQLHAVRTARNGGLQQSTRRGNGVLPIASQIYRESPYFDYQLFSFDEKSISHADRLKHCSEFPVKFYSRMHGGVVFRIRTGEREDGSQQGSNGQRKRLASYVFHPYLPFSISVKHVINQPNTQSYTNFHYRDPDFRDCL
eukprot:m.332973 g.332973  ORF g.332973 m.332973 type:complete len:596 (+) comp17038_c0_seq1:229-2016(+)